MHIWHLWKKKPKVKNSTNTKNYNSKKEILEIKKKMKLHAKRPNDILPLKLPQSNQWISGLKKKSFKCPGKKISNYSEEREN